MSSSKPRCDTPNTDQELSEESSDDSTAKLEQWKFYGQTTLNVSNRRLKNNRFYLRLLIALIGISSVGQKLGFVNYIGILIVGVLGFFFSIFWTFHIRSYKQLNAGKYNVLAELAEDLPYSPFEMEWEHLKKGNDPNKYIPHTAVEAWWPRLFALIYAEMTLWAALSYHNSDQLFWGISVIIVACWVLYATRSLKSEFGNSD